MFKFFNILAGLGAAMVNSEGSVESSTRTAPATHDASATNMCPVTNDALHLQWEKFHGSNACDKGQYNHFLSELGLNQRYNVLRESGMNVRVPNQKTVTCPAVVHDLHAPNQVKGFFTPWIVENTLGVPIVLAFVKDGVEVSAHDKAISPAEADPKAIMLPGESKVVHTYEGHVFHVRELLPDGSSGKVLLQHRVGLIPVGENSRMRNLVCPNDDVQPMITRDDGTQETDSGYARSESRELKDCNMLELGFRNMAGCPLHAYYLQPDSCDEVFKFHLGVESKVDDFMWDWQGYSKYHSTFTGHTFVFRSSFSGELVDTVTLNPTQIVDCPNLKQTVASALSSQAIILPLGEQLRNDGNVFNNTTTTTNATGTSTEQQYGSGSLLCVSSLAGGSI